MPTDLIAMLKRRAESLPPHDSTRIAVMTEVRAAERCLKDADKHVGRARQIFAESARPLPKDRIRI